MNTNNEKIINTFLQKEVVFFSPGDKPLKVGQLIVFRVKDFYYNFFIKAGESTKIFEIPYPFTQTLSGDHIIFSYKIDDFAQSNFELSFRSKLLTPKKICKLYNNVVILSALN